jgi:hypothetical protein
MTNKDKLVQKQKESKNQRNNYSVEVGLFTEILKNFIKIFKKHVKNYLIKN